MAIDEREHQPVSVSYAAWLNYPKPASTAIDRYAKAHDAWAAAFTALHLADKACAAAPALDEQALRDASAAGKPDPGRAHEQAALSAMRLANEQCRVAREAATAAADVLKAQLDTLGVDLLPQVLNGVRAAAQAYDAAVAEARAIVEGASGNLRQHSIALRTLRPALSKIGIDVSSQSFAPPEPNWTFITAHQFVVWADQVEASAAAAAAAREARERVSA